jgi:hypothetical protein
LPNLRQINRCVSSIAGRLQFVAFQGGDSGLCGGGKLEVVVVVDPDTTGSHRTIDGAALSLAADELLFK